MAEVKGHLAGREGDGKKIWQREESVAGGGAIGGEGFDAGDDGYGAEHWAQ